MASPPRTELDFVRRVPGAGIDVVHYVTPEEVWRLWLPGEAFPRIEFDPQNGQVRTGTGAAPTTPLGGGGGTATVPQGGTGLTTLTAHAVLLGEGASNVGAAAPAGAGTVLTSNGVGADPTFQVVAGGVSGPAPSGDTTGATDAAAINAALTALGSAGGAVDLRGGTYYVNATLVVPDKCALIAPDWDSTTVVQANGANLDATIASEAWYNSRSTSGLGIRVQGIQVDGNKANQTAGAGHGIALNNAYSWIVANRTVNTRGDGIHYSNRNRNGSDITNSSIQTHIEENESANAGGSGISVTNPSNSGNKTTDGFCLNNTVNAPAVSHIFIQNCAGGWLVQGNHVYGGTSTTGDAITMSAATLGTRILDNEVENFGYNTATPATYGGINVLGLASAHGSAVIANNTVACSEAGHASNVYIAIRCRAASAQACRWTIANNIVGSSAGSPTMIGIGIDTTGGGGTNVGEVIGNDVMSTLGTPFSALSTAGGMVVAANSFNRAPATPTTGGWWQGTVIWNSAAAAGGIPGWICTATGTPGTWTDVSSGTGLSAALTAGHLYVGNGSNVATDVALSGDATLAAGGALTLAAIGSATGPLGTAARVPVVTIDAKGRVSALNDLAISLALSGDLSGNAPGAITIANGAVSLAKMANLAANSIIGNNTGSAAAPIALTAAQVKSLLAITESDVASLTSDLAAKLAAASNLSDLANAGTARTNLGLGAAALLAVPITVPNGGTGATTLTDRGVLVGRGAAAVAATAVGTAGQVLTSNGTGLDPTFQTPGGGTLPDPVTPLHGGTGLTTLPAHGLVVGEGTSNVAAVGPDASSTKLLQSAGASADPSFVALSGDATVAAGGAVTIAAGAVTLAKMANEAANSLLGNNTGSPAAPAALTVAQVKTLLAITESDIANLVTDLAAKAPIASPTFTGTVTLPADPLSALQAATKQYVDLAVAGLGDKPAVAYASTSALPANTYNNGASGVGATLTGNSNGPLVVDGVTLVVGQAGERVLVAGEATQANNGWYTITQVGVIAVSPYILTRATESDQAAEIGAGYITAVIAPNTVTPGSANNGKAFISVAADPFTVGTTALTFSLVGSVYSAGNGLTLAGTSFAIDTAVTVDKTTAQTLTNKTLTSPVVNTPTGIVKGDVGLGNVDNTSDATKNAAAATLTNKTIGVSQLSGQVAVANGGTGVATLGAHGVVVGNGASAVAVTGAGSAGQVLTSNGASADPTFQAAAGGGSGTNLTRAVTQVAHGLAVQDVVRFNGTNYVKAKADSSANAEVVGLVSAVVDADNFTLVVGGRVTGLSGLTSGTVYFLSPSSAGALTATEPTTVGQVSKPLLIADSTTSGFVFNFRGEVIAAVGVDGQPRYLKFPIAYNTASILTGATIYTPTAGDILLDGWIEIVTAWDGTTPKFDIGRFDPTTHIGWIASIGVTAYPLTPADGDTLLGVSAQKVLSSRNSSLVQEGYRASAAFRKVPGKLTADPIKVVVSQDGKDNGADPGSTQGAAIVYLAVVTPV